MNAASTARLADVFRAVLELTPGVEVERVRQSGEDRWDSLAHVSLVAAIESEFDVTLDAADGLRLTSFEATRLLLEEKGL